LRAWRYATARGLFEFVFVFERRRSATRRCRAPSVHSAPTRRSPASDEPHGLRPTCESSLESRCESFLEFSQAPPRLDGAQIADEVGSDDRIRSDIQVELRALDPRCRDFLEASKLGGL
jgi:hypothetical protein